MTRDQIIYQRRQRVLAHAEETGNVALTCRTFGVSRTRFYEWRAIAERYGVEALMPKARRRAQLANATPTHVLVVTKRHIATLNELSSEDDRLVGELVRRAAAIAKARGISAGGFRTVFNTNREAGQSVFHIHLHLLGGRPMHWPPG